ncbi:CPBP family intramembrane glutamic endopeptidase [Microbulbifer sp. 2205BS26-8]|uniref:CPBP family intramembrane glutamic endopeptidase n=1 Tax=Microbulbifer sp. 2205BS26-8 TaxID=3064386 RepID=UPI00273DA975|nr:CPBP family intramembrane glutamic endopeptidase [Microbulbifer sp. 2205BS26-8]MDP5208642.1 CPBP family intramembrane metalloprotease [Microbulbifer sp. 2205BS26-8]
MTVPQMTRTGVFPLLLAIQAVCLLAAVVGGSFSGVELNLLGGALWGALFFALIGAPASFVSVVWLTRSNTAVGRTLRRHCTQLKPVFAGLSIGQIAVIAVVTGICEELLFRGFLQVWWSQLSSPLVGLLGASLVFALLHWASRVYVLLTFVFGLILGLAYQASGSLLGVITWHAMYDFLVLVTLVYNPHLLGVDAAGIH